MSGICTTESVPDNTACFTSSQPGCENAGVCTSGVCTSLMCPPRMGPCDEQNVGDVCTLDNGSMRKLLGNSEGICCLDATGFLECVDGDTCPCFEITQPCFAGETGICCLDSGSIICKPGQVECPDPPTDQCEDPKSICTRNCGNDFDQACFAATDGHAICIGQTGNNKCRCNNEGGGTQEECPAFPTGYKCCTCTTTAV